MAPRIRDHMRLPGGYGVLWNAFKRRAGCAREAERAALFAGTATRVCRVHGAPGCEALRP